MSSPGKSLFYHSDYLKVQKQVQLRVFEDEDFRVFFSVENKIARSLPRGLFGSFERQAEADFESFSIFFETVKRQLRNEEVGAIEIVHPIEIYEGFVSENWLAKLGFKLEYADLNQHLNLVNCRMHKMQERKLKKLMKSGFEVKRGGPEDLDTTYQFLLCCRQEQGLELNVSFERLNELFRLFPDRYDLFTGRLNDELVTAVVTVRTAPGIVYYYLPGTLKIFNSHSPMVGLLSYLIDYFSETSQFIDLGVSSVKGVPQKGLVEFKEKMGAIHSAKRTISFDLSL